MTTTTDSKKKRALELLPAFKKELSTEAHGVSDSNLLKFLHWKPNVNRAAERFRAHAKWRKENTFAFDDVPLSPGKDPELRRIIESDVIVAPDGMVDKEGNTVVVGRLRNNDMTDGRTAQGVCRMALYTIDRVLERDSTQLHGVTVFHDLNGLSRSNLDPAIPKLILRGIIGHFPIRIKAIYLLQAPMFFRGFFKIISRLLMPAKLRGRIQFVDEIEDIYKVIDRDQLLEEHGGNRKHESAVWVQQQIEREVDGSMVSLAECVTLGDAES